MAKVEYVKPEEVPARLAHQQGAEQEAVEHLRYAATHKLAVKLVLDAGERLSTVSQRYRKVAAKRGFTVLLGYGPTREFRTRAGKAVREASVVYVTVVTAPANVVAPIDVAATDSLVAHRERRAVEQAVVRPAPPAVVAADPVVVRRQREAEELREERQHEMDALLSVKRPAAAPAAEIPTRKSAAVVWERR